MQLPPLDLSCRRVTRRTDSVIECRFLPGQPRERLERWEHRRRDVPRTREDWFREAHANGTSETVWFAARNEDLRVLDGEIWELTTSRAVNRRR